LTCIEMDSKVTFCFLFSERKSNKNAIPNFTVKRSFTLRNTGELPFYVHGYNINNVPCQGYGFRILDCAGYEMMPNTSKKIDIAFTPDFTMSRIQRTLTIFTSLGEAFNYTLQATVPTHTLSKCSSSLPRPNWEPVLYYSIVCVMGFLLFCILVASYFEADRIFVADILKRKVKQCNGTPPYQKDKIFDLKALGTSHMNGVQTPPPITKMNLPPSLLSKVPRATIDMSNGHIEPKIQDSFWKSLSSILKSLFARKSSSSRKKTNNNNVENPKAATGNPETLSSNQDKPTPTYDKEPKPATSDTIIPEKSTTVNHQPQQKITLRRPKATKRSHTEGSNGSESQSYMSYDRKPTKTSTSVTDKKGADLVSSTLKDSTQTPITTYHDSTGLSNFDDIKVEHCKSSSSTCEDLSPHFTCIP